MCENEAKKKNCCPYCDQEMMATAFPYCQTCSLTILYCPGCREPVPRDTKTCSHCGAEIKG